MRNTYAVPEHLIPQAKQLARALGQSASDENSFGPVRYRIGNQPYSVASGQIDLSKPLEEPAWGADMALAAQAQGEIGGEILVSDMDDPQGALDELGLDPIEDDPAHDP